MSLLSGLRRGPRLYSKPTASGNIFPLSSKTYSANPSLVSIVPRQGARRVGSLLILSTMGLAYFQIENNSSRAMCSSGGRTPDMPSPVDLLSQLMEKYQVEINEMGLSGLAGVCSGYCLKRVSEEIAIGIGAVFMLLQTLQHMGYININYKKVNADMTQKLDLDGDGKLNASDFKLLINNITSYLSDGLPSATGFASGFGLGFYYA